MINGFLFNWFFIFLQRLIGPAPGAPAILQETGDYLLQETGDRILQEQELTIADLKITQLTALTAPTADDLLPIVDDQGGTPVTKKITVANLFKDIIDPTPKTTNYVVTSSDKTILGDATTGDITFSLPAITGTQGTTYTFIKTDSTANKVIIDADGAETINGNADYPLINNNEAVQIVSDGTLWRVKGAFTA